ncbi:MAG: RNA polymerase sigma factor [Ilumatobacteraceae bacterium]
MSAVFEEVWSVQRDRLIRAVALATGDADLAAEAVDEAFARAYPRWRQVGSLDQPAGWVYRVAVNWSRSRLRRGRRPVPGWMVPTSEPPVEPTDPQLLASLAALPSAHRDVVVCRIVLGLSEAQTAAALEVPAGTVKSRLSRALDTLAASVPRLDEKEASRD